jgi:hypothetical protein
MFSIDFDFGPETFVQHKDTSQRILTDGLPITGLRPSLQRTGLAIQRSQNPFLQNFSKVRFYFAKHEAHPRGLAIENGSRGFEILSGVMDSEQNRVVKFKGSRRLDETSVQTQLCDTGGERRGGRILGRDLRVGAKRKP